MWKWRSRDDVHDRSHTPHRLQTTLTPAQEAVAVALRKALLLPLDDLLAVVREFLNPHVSRSGLDRCLRRHGVGNLQALKPKEPKPAHGTFKAYEPGYLHIDIKYLPQMSDEGPPPLPLRGHRPGDALGLRAHLPGADRGQRAALPARSGARGPDADHPRADRQRQGFHRPPLRAAQARGHRPARVRHALRRAWHRASPDPADAAADERHGRALQRPHRGRPTRATASGAARTWSRPSCATSTFTTASSRNQP